MSAQYRTEYAKLIAKYAKTFGIHESLIVCRNARGEDSIHVPSRPDLPSWGMGAIKPNPCNYRGEDWSEVG